MDWNDTLLGLVCLSAGVLALRVLGQRPWPRGWLTVLLLLTAVLSVGWWKFPNWVGFAGLAIWLLLVVLPALGQRLALQWAATQRSVWAQWLARLVTALHPADGWPQTRLFIEALAALQQGRGAEARALLQRLQQSGSTLSHAATALQVRQAGDWTGYLQWVETHPGRQRLLQDGQLLDTYLQALGETGQRARMVQEFQSHPAAHSQAATQLRVAALVGDEITVGRLLTGALRSWPPDAAAGWRATAEQVRGYPAAGEVFERLSQSSSLLVAVPAAQRLQRPLSPLGAGELGEAEREALRELSRDIAHDGRFAVLSSVPWRRPLVTYLLAALLALNFVRELPGGAEDPDNLVELGAIVIPRRPPVFMPWLPSYDEWWRPITAAFLHFGWPHFLMNLCGLLYLGARLERAWGPWRTLLCYAAAVMVSMSVTPWWMERTATEMQILAGASGGIMGLLGGLIGHLLIGRLRRRTPQVARQLTVLLGFVLLQTVFDLSIEQVSQQAHLLGLATGCVFGVATSAATFWRSEDAGGDTARAATAAPTATAAPVSPAVG